MPRQPRSRSALLVVGLAAAVLAACSPLESAEAPVRAPAAEPDAGSSAGGPDAGPTPDAEGSPLPEEIVLASAVRPFDACTDFLDHVTTAALEEVGPYGLDGMWFGYARGDALDEETAADGDDAGMEDMAAPVPADVGPVSVPSEGVDFSGTNVQEAHLDEPDVVKTDGRHLFSLSEEEGRLRVLDLSDDVPREVGGLDLPDAWGAQLLLDGDRLLVLSSGGSVRPLSSDSGLDAFALDGGGGTSTIRLVDVADPSDPVVREQLLLDGEVRSSRLGEGSVRIAVSSQPTGLPFASPSGGGLRAERDAIAANRRIVSESRADNWIPYYVHETADGDLREGTLVACDAIGRPPAFSGLGTTTILSLDLAAGILPASEVDDDGADDAGAVANATAVLGTTEVVSASADRLYVATTRWPEDAAAPTVDEVRTDVHAFDISEPARAPYIGSGSVAGTLLGNAQWALSSHEGVLRVASTTDAWDAVISESRVTTLEEAEGELVEVGLLDGLGRTEQIHAVRFIGDVGYMVTFRQVDPLYVVDLSDPAAPTMTGELKIPGYSAYLHPVGEGLLLGVGQDADPETGMTEGAQMSLFDVADPTSPERIATAEIGGWSAVEHDHRAFLWWPARELAVVPFERWDWDDETDQERVANGAAAFTVTADGIAEETRVSHLPNLLGDDADPDDPAAYDLTWRGTIRRALVSDERLLTVSDAGVAVHDLEDLTELGFTRFD